MKVSDAALGSDNHYAKYQIAVPNWDEMTDVRIFIGLLYNFS